MKNAFSLALLSLLLTLAWNGPAGARGVITVINDTDTGAAIQLNFYTHLCRDDHVNVAPKGRFTVNSGLCETKSFHAQIRDAKGVITQCKGSSGANTFAIFRIRRGDAYGVPSDVCGIRHI